MKVVPIRWHGSTRVERMRVLLQERMDAWLEQWAVAPGRIDCALAHPDAEHADDRAGDRWLGCMTSHGEAWLCAAASTAEKIGGALAAAAIGDGHGLADAVGRRALTDLVRQLFDAPAAELREQQKPADALEPRRGTIGFVMKLDRVRIDFHLDHRLCDALVPVAPNAQPLTRRADAIGAAEVTLRAVVDLGAIDLQQTALLRPGEVIKTRVPLDRAIDVQTESGRTLMTGTLVAADGHRALRLARISTDRTEHV